ncbi:MAG: hypothetical protein KC506_02255 [Nanoarchaeota archaeon]|nr:hypothetical protein [Nanoarchaeota archaeon]
MIDTEGVHANHLAPETFIQVYSGANASMRPGDEKIALMARVSSALYRDIPLHVRQEYLERDLEKARRGERIICRGIGTVLLPERYGPNASNGNP